jgi:hypothetical protein
MATLKVKVVVERVRDTKYAWNDSILGNVYNYETGEMIPDLQSFMFTCNVGGGCFGCPGPLPYPSEMHGEITYYDTTDSGKTTKQFVEVTELVVRTKEPEEAEKENK